jgi:toxin CptA
VLLALLTFLLGAALSQVSLCAVAATQQWVVMRQAAGLQRLLLAASGAGVVLLVLSRCLPKPALLPADLPINVTLVVGSVLLAVGALLNGACYLGSVLYLGSGNMNFLFTLIGLGLGMRCSQLAGAAAVVASGLPATPVRPLRWAGLVTYALIVTLCLWLTRVRRTVLWPLCAGLFAALVYARHPGWSYGQLIDSVAHADWRGMTWLANLAVLALFAGAIAGSIYTGRWHWQWPAPARVLRCLSGGILMGVGAGYIPGGNDMLLLWSIPGLALYGAVAYLIMMATLAALLYGAEIWRHRSRRALKL